MYTLRISGSNEFVSKIDPTDRRCWPVGSVATVVGWSHPQAIRWENRPAAEAAAAEVMRIEGFHCTVEPDAGSMMQEDLNAVEDIDEGWEDELAEMRANEEDY